MSNQKHSLFILGAGVSVDHLYPTGQELLEDIVNILDGRIPIFEQVDLGNGLEFTNKTILAILLCLKESKNAEIFNEKQFEEYAQLIDFFHTRLRFSTPRSIDDFIDSQIKNELLKEKQQKIANIGKVLIVLRLIRYENRSLEYNSCIDDNHPDCKTSRYKQKRTFFTELWQQLYGASSYNDFLNNLKKISFITFNYDRLLEYFLYNSAKHFFPLYAQQLQNDLSNVLDVTHMYGRLGHLGWEHSTGIEYGDVSMLPFITLIERSHENLSRNHTLNFTRTRDGWSLYHEIAQTIKDPSLAQYNLTSLYFIFESINKIRTYTEVIESQDKSTDSNFAHLYFLGFSFHPLNILKLRDYIPSNKRMIAYASVYGMKQQQAANAEVEIKKTLLGRDPYESGNSYISGYFEQAQHLTIPEFFKTLPGVRYFSP